MAKPTVFVFTTAYHPLIGGAEVAVQEVAGRLGGEFRFCVVTARFRRDLPSREERPEATVIRIGFGAPFDKWLLPVWGAWVGWRAVRRASRHGPSLLWGMDVSFGSAAAFLVKRFRPSVRFILTVQYGYGEERLASGRFGLIAGAFRFILGRADAVTAISTHLAEVAHRFGWHGPVAVIPNGVDLQRFFMARTRRPPGSPPTVITVSRLVPKNGIDTLIRAIAEVRTSLPEIRCHILGGGPERGSLEALVQSFGLAEAVTFFGDVPHAEVPRYLREASISVRPSRSEGMGNAFVEALAAGLPIIGTPVGGITDIIEDGKTGLFARVDDPADLAEKIKRLLGDPRLAGEIVRNGQAMVRERFSWDAIAATYSRAFIRCLKPCILVATGIFPPDIGGPATYSRTFAEGFSRRGYEVRVLTYTDNEKSKVKSRPRAESRGQKLKVLEYSVTRVSRGIPKGLRHLWYFIRCLTLGRGAELIYAQDTVSVGLPAALAARFLAKPLLVRAVGDYAWEQGVLRFGVTDGIDEFQQESYGGAVGFLRKIQRFVVGNARTIVTPSEYFQSIVTGWGVPGARVTVIPNPLGTDAPPLSRSEARRKLGIGDEEVVIVSAGRLVPWKGFDTLIEVFPEIKKSFPHATLAIIGDGPERRNLESRIQKLALGTYVRLTGGLARGDLLAYLKAADLSVLYSGFESFSFQIGEAMACGVPVIASRKGSNPEMVEDGRTGILVPYPDRPALSAAIRQALARPGLRERLASAASRSLGRFSPGEALGALERLLQATLRPQH